MNPESENLSVGRNIKIAFFHIGSGMADVLTTGVWNRIMISDLGIAATPVGLLVSLRYFLAPLGIWAGRVSDERTVLGFRRLFWIWFGRLMMVLSTLMLGFSTAQLARDVEGASPIVWVAIAASLLLFSLGNAISGSTFLALIYDRSREEQRGRAVGIVWTFLLIGFTVGGILFGLLLPADNLPDAQLSFAPERLETLFIVAALSFASLWFVSLLGEERRGDVVRRQESGHEGQVSMRKDLALVWRSRPMRYFLFYLTFSMFFAFSQDLVLEPFAGDIFGMSAAVTNRFAAYWGGTSILGSLLFIYLSRRYSWLSNTVMSQMGAWTLVATFALLALSAVAEIRGIITPGLLLLGIGLGMWNIGSLGLMMDLSPLGRAGTFLGFWTLSVTFARGGGVASGGIVRDLFLQLTGNLNIAYAAVFFLGALGLLASLWALSQVNVRDFKVESKQHEASAILAGAMD